MIVGIIAVVGGVLVSPILWFGVSYLASKIPFLADLLSRMFWELLGNIPVFELAAKVLEQAFSRSQFTGSHFFLTLLELLSVSVVDSFIMGVSVFVFKAIFSKFTRQGMLVITGGQAATVLGVAFGALMTITKGALMGLFQQIFSLLLILGLLLLGMGLMLGKPIRSYYAGARTTALGGMLMRLLVDANLAWCCVSLTVCSMEGPRIALATGDYRVWIAWYGATLLLYFVLDSLLLILSPSMRSAA